MEHEIKEISLELSDDMKKYLEIFNWASDPLNDYITGLLMIPKELLG